MINFCSEPNAVWYIHACNTLPPIAITITGVAVTVENHHLHSCSLLVTFCPSLASHGSVATASVNAQPEPTNVMGLLSTDKSGNGNAVSNQTESGQSSRCSSILQPSSTDTDIRQDHSGTPWCVGNHTPPWQRESDCSISLLPQPMILFDTHQQKPPVPTRHKRGSGSAGGWLPSLFPLCKRTILSKNSGCLHYRMRPRTPQIVSTASLISCKLPPPV